MKVRHIGLPRARAQALGARIAQVARKQGIEQGKRIAVQRVFDVSRSEYPGSARIIQHFLREYFYRYLN
ncbi:hypothetical protein [Bordetella genomosp. 9]|uniref:hypothetical protein n=1 Tax=Bordetella genomosp. 9 TaxID=1416803 RepID=UPI00117881C6|nr:hypothetical protein [Bordetella genomosp. 9]